MASVRQTSFAGGEVAPAVWARSELERYASSLRRCRNFLPLPQGPVVNRPGMQFVARAAGSGQEDSDGNSFADGVRLIPFVYSDEEAYVLEVGGGYIRFFQNGAPVVSGGNPVEVETDYSLLTLSRLKYAQVGDVLTLVHPDRRPRELRRTGPNAFALVDIDFSRPATALTSLDEPGIEFVDVLPPNEDPTPDGNGTADFLEADDAHPLRDWEWAVTSVAPDAHGVPVESVATAVTQVVAPGSTTSMALKPPAVVLYPDRPITVRWGDSGLPPPPGVTGYRVYRGRGGILGYVGEAALSGGGIPQHHFVDYGHEPNYAIRPPLGSSPFDATPLTPGDEDFPSVVAFFEERRIFANTRTRPNYLWASRVGDYSTFDRFVPAEEDGSLELALGSRKREEIRSLLGLERLLAFTNSSIWGLSGQASLGDRPVARAQSEVGASWLDPIVAGDAVLFVRAKGQGVRETLYEQERGKFTGADLSVLASHLVLGHTLVDWAYQEDPWGVVWCVRNDGVLLSLTYQREQQVWGWAAHETQGQVRAVCCVPEGNEDAVYLLVERLVAGLSHHSVERLASRILPLDEEGNPDVTRGIFLDSCTSYEGPPATSFGGLTHLEGMDVMALGDGSVQGPFTVTSGTITLDVAASRVHVGLAYASTLELLDIAPAEVRGRPKAVSRVDFEVEASRGLLVGETEDSLYPWELRDAGLGFGAVPLFTGPASVAVSSTYNTGGRALLRQEEPLPVTVLSVARQVDVGGE